MSEDLPSGMSEDDVELPDGYTLDDVIEFESDVEAFVDAGEGYRQPFNPQNGRMYETIDPGCTDYDSVRVVGGLQVNCAYDDCDGHTTVMVEGEVSRTCGECKSPMMGRGQFSDTQQHRRSDRSTIQSRTESMRDEFAREMKRLTDAGVTTAQAIDVLMCGLGEIAYEEWAEARGVSQEAVKRNIYRASTEMGESITYSTRGGR